MNTSTSNNSGLDLNRISNSSSTSGSNSVTVGGNSGGRSDAKMHVRSDSIFDVSFAISFHIGTSKFIIILLGIVLLIVLASIIRNDSNWSKRMRSWLPSETYSDWKTFSPHPMSKFWNLQKKRRKNTRQYIHTRVERGGEGRGGRFKIQNKNKNGSSYGRHYQFVKFIRFIRFIKSITFVYQHNWLADFVSYITIIHIT